ncbi:histidinol-phosphate transaminase [Shewanella sp. JM162201]|uniref:Histidinol-phosphate aminotransferase n=1 Tax=Shewanella jiangmenensis TaxID=2837387 RepID=A0ABS5V6W6_9GAMM|nr:histidinol-phosphate transaminase [Shewanella jiangmenensis]MBT1445592.1 histidinol-phosphate transaminase [Shewanella jiangmenensis]
MNQAPFELNPNCLAARLARPELLTLVPYQSARRIGGSGEIWVNANESPFNRSGIEGANRYPECQPPGLITAYAAYAGVDVNELVCGRGADEAIELLIRTFCVPGKDSIGIFNPTYGMYAISAATFNVAVKSLPLGDDFTLPLKEESDGNSDGKSDNSDDLSAFDGCKLVFVCNPNNPTGTVLPLGDIATLARRFPNALLVVDEAYIEFARTEDGKPLVSATSLMQEFSNLVVLRTLSKAFGLAGARCGFLLANREVCELVMRVIAPYPVPVPVSRLGEAALSEQGIAQMRADVNELIEQGKRIIAALNASGLTTAPSGGNYVLAFSDKVDALAKALASAGIVARRYAHPRLAQAIRISFSDKRDTDAIIAAIKAFGAQGAK